MDLLNFAVFFFCMNEPEKVKGATKLTFDETALGYCLRETAPLEICD